MVIIESPMSTSMVLPANKTIDEHILAAKPIKSPTIASFMTMMAYWITVEYSRAGLGTTNESIMVTKAEKPIFAWAGMAEFPRKGIMLTHVTILTNMIRRYSI